MSAPVISEVGENAYSALGPWTEGDEDAEWHLRYFVEAMFGAMQVAKDVSGTASTGQPGWQRMLDPDTVLPEFLAWMGQFVGVTLPVGLSVAEERTYIKESNGFKRGTPGYITSIAGAFLTGTKRVDLIERYLGNVAHYLVRTYTGETPDPAIVEAALLAAKPGGDKLFYIAQAGPTIDQLNGTIDDLNGTIDSFTDQVP